MTSVVGIEHKDPLLKVHTQLSSILRIFNSDRKINTEEFGNLCRNTYLLILDSFPWANISPALHKLLAHSEEILRDINFGYGLKCFSEEGSEACKKLIRKYREHLRKFSFEDNLVDIFIRLASDSDPVLLTYRTAPVFEKCGEYGHAKRTKSCRESNVDLLQSPIEKVENELII